MKVVVVVLVVGSYIVDKIKSQRDSLCKKRHKTTMHVFCFTKIMETTTGTALKGRGRQHWPLQM